ncbi:MAG: alkaline phosphatase D family protein [Acidimicrobiia bacterium]
MGDPSSVPQLGAAQPGAGPRALRRAGRIWLAGIVVVAGTVFLAGGFPADTGGNTVPAEIEDRLRLAFIGLAAIGGVLALRFEPVGAVVMGVAAAAIGLLTAFDHPGSLSIALAVLFAVPAVLTGLAWRWRRSRRALVTLAAVMGAVLFVEVVTAQGLYAYHFGPVHPASPATPLAVDGVEWMWAGGVTSRQATVVARLGPGRDRARLLLADDAGGRQVSAAVPVDGDRIARLSVDGLSPATRYRYTVEVDGRPDRSRGRGHLATMPEGPASFTLAVGACARTGSDGVVFDAIRRLDPLLYLITGDLHYENISRADSGVFLGAYDRVLAAPAQAALYRAVPVDYVWDDHDYGPNDAGATSSSRAAAHRAYRQAVPHPPLPAGPGGAIHHAFTIGRVRVVVTDTRSERAAGTMLGSAQREWLLGELRRADEHALVIWVNSVPWIDTPRDGADTWGGYAEERRLIADTIAGEGIANLVMLSGDAHMVAIDDGTNSGYAASGGGGFPILHAAALDRRGNVKGGPYSHGTFPGPGRFGVVEVDDRGTSVSVELSGRDYHSRTLVSHAFEVSVPRPRIAGD